MLQIINGSRRRFLSFFSFMAIGSLLKAQKQVKQSLDIISNRKTPDRKIPLAPAGAISLEHMAKHCTACHLCVSVCPHQVLRPSDSLRTFMQPKISYERGYCSPECTKCSEVCPTGAIKKISKEEKSFVQIGHAIFIKENCITITDHKECDECARQCPFGAILIVSSEPDCAESPKIPLVNTDHCIGCGTCENICPAQPYPAIYVEGYAKHRVI